MSSEDQQGRVAGRIAETTRAEWRIPKKVLGKLARQIPLGFVGDPEDLASDESKIMTGSSLLLDGGISAR